MLLGYPVALISVAVAFAHGGGRLYAYAAYLLVAVPGIFFTIVLSGQFGPIPLAVGIPGFVGLGYFGYLTRHRSPPRKIRKAWPELAFTPGPTGKTVTARDVMGAWRFYVDAAGRTVDIVFREDGTFTQTVTHNREGTRVCPGGTWKLDGPHVELNSYQSVQWAESCTVSWWLGDTADGFALFGPDHPALGIAYRISKVEPMAELPN